MADPQHPILSKSEARAIGAKRYFTGEPCPNGHVSERYVYEGRCVACIKCKKPRDKNYGKIWQENNRERCRAYWRKHVNKKDKAVRREKLRDWKRRNPEKWAALVAKSKNRPPSVRRALWREYAKRYPTQRANASRARRAREKHAEGVHTASDVASIIKRQSGQCAYCPKKLGRQYHVDHIIPLSKGGSNWPKNIQVLCPACNMAKGRKDPIDYARETGRLI
jgi:5-methylcytosine-specific restriction endonuclease McrA